jgi:hypothetical protein
VLPLNAKPDWRRTRRAMIIVPGPRPNPVPPPTPPPPVRALPKRRRR